MKRIFLAFLANLLFCAYNATAQIVYSDYSDPDVCEGENGDYWLTASSFQCTPGLPILHSTDMIHWKVVNYALERLVPIEHYNSVQHGNGVWAPSIRRHNDTYYIYWGDPDFGVFMVKTKNPLGKWDEPVLVMEGKGVIDTTPLWDDDGRCYLVNGWANSRCGFNSVITVRELSADGTHAIGKPIMVYDGLVEGDHTIEGPKFYKQNGYYYILAPAGSVTTGWQLALRSKNVYGPYERKIVFNKDGIHQGGWVKDKFVCFQEVGAYGRILHLLDVEMKDGWPMMKLNKNDKLKGTTGEGYQWHANYQDAFGFNTTTGTRVYAHNVSKDFRSVWEVPNLYLKKLDGETFTDTLSTIITARADGDESGFIIMGRDYCRISASFNNGTFTLKQITCKNADSKGTEVSKDICTLKHRTYTGGAKTFYETKVTFRIECMKGALCKLSYSTDGKTFLPIQDTFQAREGRWIGAKYGVFSIAPNDGLKGWIDLSKAHKQ